MSEIIKDEFQNDVDRISNMTDKQAAEVLEKVQVWMNGGRRNGKTLLSLAYNKAIEKAIKSLRTKALDSQWRPISEPPKEHDFYLVTCEFEVARGTDIALFYPDREGEEQWSLNYVTAWKPLPKPYESEVEE